MEARIGKANLKPTLAKIVMGDKLLDASANYTYSIGSFFVEMEKNSNGDFETNIDRRPGLTIYPVFDNTILTNLFPPQDQLLIL